MQTQETLFSKIELLENKLQGANFEIKVKDERLRQYESENSRLREIMLSLKRQVFGPKKERWVSEEQLLFNEAEVAAQEPGAESEQEISENEVEDETHAKATEVKPHMRVRGKRRPLPSHLPREIIKIELPLDEQFLEDGTKLKPVGVEISEKLDYEPAKTKVIEYHRVRYGVESGDPVKTAPQVPSIIPKGIGTPALHATIVVQKYADGLPLYRQEEIFKRLDIDLTRSTMGRWVVQLAAACMPIRNILEDRLMSSSYVSCDETHVQVLKEKDRKPESKSWMWVRATPTQDKKIVLFDYDPHRSGEVAKKFLSEYRGVLQVDGYGAYNQLEKQDGLVRIGCNMHGRRKFEDAKVCGAKAGQAMADEALKYYHELYAIEEQMKDKDHKIIVRFEERKKYEMKMPNQFGKSLRFGLKKIKTKCRPRVNLVWLFIIF